MRNVMAIAICGIAAMAAATACAYDGKIAFTSDRDGNPEIYVMTADGADVVRLTNNKSYDDQPALSPDGELVAFVSNRDGNNELYLVSTDGKNLKRLTETDYAELDPAFAPDGESILFTTMQNGDKDVARLSLANGKVEVLVAGEGDQFMADLAADGALAFVEGGDDRALKIKEGNQTRTLIAQAGILTMPAFSPDGKVIYFTSNRGGDYDILAVDRATGKEAEVITLKSLEGNACPASDGSCLAVASDRDGDLEIYVFSATGERLAQLTENEAADYEPSWSK